MSHRHDPRGYPLVVSCTAVCRTLTFASAFICFLSHWFTLFCALALSLALSLFRFTAPSLPGRCSLSRPHPVPCHRHPTAVFVAITLFFSIMTAASAGAEADRDCSLELGLILDYLNFISPAFGPRAPAPYHRPHAVCAIPF